MAVFNSAIELRCL